MSVDLSNCKTLKVREIETVHPHGESHKDLYVHNVVALGGTLWVFGGLYSTGPLTPNLYVQALDYLEKRWRLVKEVPTDFPFAGLMKGAFVVDDTIYIVGERSDINTLWQFDPLLNEIILIPTRDSPPRNVNDCTFYSEFTGDVLLFGGQNKSSMFVLELKSKQWSKRKIKGVQPPSVGYPQVCGSYDTVYVFGKPKTIFADQLYTLKLSKSKSAAFVWSMPLVKGQLPSKRSRATISYIGGRILVYGGIRLRDNGTEHMSEFNIGTIKESSWSVAKEQDPQGLTQRRSNDVSIEGILPTSFGHVATIVPGRILIVGGFNRSSRLVYEITAGDD